MAVGGDTAAGVPLDIPGHHQRILVIQSAFGAKNLRAKGSLPLLGYASATFGAHCRRQLRTLVTARANRCTILRFA